MIQLAMAPIYTPYRVGIAAADTLATVPEALACNAAGYDSVHVQVAPSGGANPTVAVVWWSAALGKFVQEHTPISRAGVGADLGFEFTVQPKGRRFAVIVTTIAAGACAIHVAGFNLNSLV
jgi:hypothetical protein